MTGYRTRPSLDQEKFNHYGSKARIIIEAAFGKLKGQWRCLTVGLRTRTPQDWKDTVVTCATLHNLTILCMDQGWAWKAGVVRESTDPDAFERDPHPVGQNPSDRIPDDRACKPRRDGLMAGLLARIA
jgi:DDE superfamily endonuclease